MRIGVFFTVRKSNGGAYQYAVTFLDTLKKNPAHRYVIFNESPDLPTEYRSLPNFYVVDFAKSQARHPGDNPESRQKNKTHIKQAIYSLLLRLHLFRLLRVLTKRSQRKVIETIKAKKLDLAIFTMSNKLAFLLDMPTIVPIHDINHKLHPQFPEFSSGKIWAQREYITSQIVKKAVKILVDSPVSREDIIKNYHARSEKLVVLPFLPPNYLAQTVGSEKSKRFFQKNNIPEKYIFYPAQLWPHKNHINLVKALGILISQRLHITLILTGAKKEEFGIWGSIMQIAKTQHIENQIKFLGYVENEEIVMLYQHAAAMVMPALVGPTYIPIYEAWAMHCPVLCSDIRGLKEQAGNAALLFNPENTQDIAEKIKQIWTEENLRQQLISHGTERLSQWTEKNFSDRLNSIIDEFQPSYASKTHS